MKSVLRFACSLVAHCFQTIFSMFAHVQDVEPVQTTVFSELQRLLQEVAPPFFLPCSRCTLTL